MKRINVHAAKTHLSRFVAAGKPEEAQLPSIDKTSKAEPRIGVAKGEFEVPDSFLDPLPDHILKAFSGQ